MSLQVEFEARQKFLQYPIFFQQPNTINCFLAVAVLFLVLLFSPGVVCISFAFFYQPLLTLGIILIVLVFVISVPLFICFCCIQSQKELIFNAQQGTVVYSETVPHCTCLKVCCKDKNVEINLQGIQNIKALNHPQSPNYFSVGFELTNGSVYEAPIYLSVDQTNLIMRYFKAYKEDQIGNLAVQQGLIGQIPQHTTYAPPNLTQQVAQSYNLPVQQHQQQNSIQRQSNNPNFVNTAQIQQFTQQFAPPQEEAPRLVINQTNNNNQPFIPPNQQQLPVQPKPILSAPMNKPPGPPQQISQIDQQFNNSPGLQRSTSAYSASKTKQQTAAQTLTQQSSFRNVHSQQPTFTKAKAFQPTVQPKATNSNQQSAYQNQNQPTQLASRINMFNKN